MRIGLITGEYPPMQGGIADFTRSLAREWVAQGHTVHILTDQRGANDLDDDLTDIDPYDPYDDREPPIVVTNAIRRWNAASLGAAHGWALMHRLAVVNIQYETAAYGMSASIHLLPRALPCPTVTTFHDLHVPYLFPKAGRLRFAALRTLARGSAGVIATNAEDEARLRIESGITRLAHIPIGAGIPDTPLSAAERAGLRDQLAVAPDTLLIGYFGFMNASKGVDTLLSGAALAIERGQNAHILLIGGGAGTSDPTNAAYARQIDAQIESLGLAARVSRTGYADPPQISAFLQVSDVIALPFTDGASFRRTSLLAALANGCPVITTTPAVPIPELVDAVYLIPASSPGALADALADLGAHPALRLRLGANARALGVHFAWPSIAARTAAFFAEVIGAPGLVK